MRQRVVAFIGALAVAGALVELASGPIIAQSDAVKPTAAAKAGPALKTQWGDPDLQGMWNNETLTPLERPKQFENKEFLTEAEAAAHEAEVISGEVTPAGQVSHTLDKPGTGGAVGLYNDFWMEQGKKVVPSRRTSLIVDPPDGKIPLTPEAQKRAEVRAEARRNRGPAASWEDLSIQNRCILWSGGAPHLPSFYNNNYQILQTPDHVAFVAEMIHNTRIIPLDGRPHLTQDVRQYFGDSRGHWEGDTLVVETTNLTDKTLFRGATENMRIIERFTRVDVDNLKYEFTVNDPATFTRPWSAEVPMRKTDAYLYEYACHEGNYSLQGILSGARAAEREAASK